MPTRTHPAASPSSRHRSRPVRIATRSGLQIALLVTLCATPAFAQQWNFVGSRQQAMGGAGMAITEDSTAFYWNPAAFGFKKKGEWDVNLPITVNLSVENELLEATSDLAVRSDDLEGLIDRLEADDPTILTDGSIGDAIDWLVDFDALGEEPQSVHTQIGIGLLGHVGNFGFGGLSNTTGYVFPDVDLSQIGFSQGLLATELSGLPQTTAEPELRNRIASLGGFWNDTNAAQFVGAFEGDVDVSDPAVQDVIFLLAQGTGGDESFADNDSGVVVTGLSIQEIGVSYGYALPSPWLKRWLHKKVSVGATAKYMMGIAFVRSARYDNLSTGGLGNLDDFSDNRISHRFGLDLGIDYRPFEFARIGISARNVNVPKFDGGEFGDIKLRPQVRLGMAAEPIERWIVALDVDLTENRNPELQNSPADDPFRSRLVSLGTEYTIPLGKPSALALRFGTYKNTVDDINEGWALTGGLGLKLWSFVLDLSAGGGLERERIRTDTNEYVNIPDRLNLGLGLKWEKSL